MSFFWPLFNDWLVFLPIQIFFCYDLQKKRETQKKSDGDRRDLLKLDKAGYGTEPVDFSTNRISKSDARTRAEASVFAIFTHTGTFRQVFIFKLDDRRGSEVFQRICKNPRV
jgi:hypothetical protein